MNSSEECAPNVALTRDQIELLAEINELAGGRAFLVGGVVRDLFLGVAAQARDLDFLFESDANQIAASLAQQIGGALQTFPDFFTAKVSQPPKYASLREIDLARARSEHYPQPGSLPMVMEASAEEDLKRRDFTINALALPTQAILDWFYESAHGGSGDLNALRPRVLDLFNGLADLDLRRIRVLHPQSFRDDPTRIFRACRYAGRLAGQLASETRELALDALEQGALGTVSAFRKVAELRKIMHEPSWFAILQVADDLALLERLDLIDKRQRIQAYTILEKLNTHFASSSGLDLFYLLLLALTVSGLPNSREAPLRKLGFGHKLFVRLEVDLGFLGLGPAARQADQVPVSAEAQALVHILR